MDAVTVKRNPTPKKGERNLFCPYYNRCLDEAVARSWNTWHCTKCPYVSTQPKISEDAVYTDGAVLYCSVSPRIDRMLRNDTF